MDSHYDIVMKRREQLEIAHAASRRYFAYSTVLDRAAFDEWRTQHAYEFFELPEGEVVEAIDLDLVYDFPSRWWGGRVAGLADVPGASVFGRLFEIAGKDWPIVEHKEGVITAMCIERRVHVRRANGEIVEASAFTTRPERASLDGPVSARFVEALVRGGTAAGLPAPYVARLGRAP